MKKIYFIIAISLLVSLTSMDIGWPIDGDSSSGESAKTLTNDIGTKRKNSLGMEFVYIKPGVFMMGSPPNEKGRDKDEKQHRVTLTKGFYLGKTEVTVGQFRKFITATAYKTDADKNAGGVNGCNAMINADGKRKWGWKPGSNWQSPGFKQSDDMPVVCVSWNDTQAYIRWLSSETGQTYRLPTEAEWEYAARADSRSSRFWGDDPKKACRYANVADQSEDGDFSWDSKHECSDGYYYSSPIGNFKPNNFVLYDMIGNVWEWCHDWYDKDYYSNSPSTDPAGPNTGSGRVIRGGGWYDFAGNCRSANRVRGTPDGRSVSGGFRLVLFPAR